ncbi:hypothetical protein ACWD25_57325 [Streptomyces sp. NPDC002920]
MPTIHYSNGAHIGIRGGKIKLHTEIYHQQDDGSSPVATKAITDEQYQQACDLSSQLNGKYGNGIFSFAEEHKDAVLAFAASIWGQPVNDSTEPKTDRDPVAEARQAADEARAAKQRYEEACDTMMEKLDTASRLTGISANECAEIAKGALSRPTVLKRMRATGVKSHRWYVPLTIAKTGVIQGSRVTAPRGTSQTEIYGRAVAQLADLYAETGESLPELLPLSETPMTWLD